MEKTITKSDDKFVYTEAQVTFLNGAFLGALLKTGIVQLKGTMEDIKKVGKDYWEQYRNIGKLPDQQDVP